MKAIFNYFLSGILITTLFASCDKEYESIEVIDDRNVTTYIQQNNLNMSEYNETGVYYQIVEPGTGTPLDYTEQTALILTNKSLDGSYSALDTFAYGSRYYGYLGYFSIEPIRTGLKEVLKNKGGTLRAIIPSRLAFGRNGSANIPGNASLDVTVKALDRSKLPAYEDEIIRRYLAANSLTGFTKTSTGIYYKVQEMGTGSPITVDSTVVAQYTGKYLSGVVFDRTVAGGTGVSFPLSGSQAPIKGWSEAIPLIREGGSIRFILPSTMAYGYAAIPNNGMPAFSTLDFDVKITEVKQ